MKPTYLLIAAATLALASCARGGQEEGAALKYVQDIISGEEASARDILAGYGNPARDGAIYVAGPYAPAVRAMKNLLRFEYFDNVTGNPGPDGLPDFAGETICAIYDMAPEAATQEELRTAAVRGVIQAMDSVCFVSPYDNEGLDVKPVAKVVLLASPNAAFGAADIDTLLTTFNAKIPVVCPLRSVLEPFFKGRKGRVKIAVLTTEDYASGDAYRGYVEYLGAKHGLDSAACIVSADSSVTAVLTQPVDLLLIDNPALDAREIYENVKPIPVVDLAARGAEECFRAMRSGNLFTHRVAWPVSMEYMAAEDKILQYNTKYLSR
ncbi:MAG: hypothetical protein J5771_03155 [Bacteroidales bacterium]|nr:hypothetical protein [Bacteroidales bacterium]